MFSKKLIVIMVAMILVVALGCSRSKSDAEIASEVQNKINTDTGLTKPEVTAGAVEGAVTLSGRVANESDKAAAASDATQIAGVKTVVNNLEVEESAEMPKSGGTRSVRTSSSPRSHSAPAAAASAERGRAIPEEQPITISEGTEISARMGGLAGLRKSQTGRHFSGDSGIAFNERQHGSHPKIRRAGRPSGDCERRGPLRG
jgi:BON domain